MLIAKDIKKVYRTGAKGVAAVNGVSLEINRGESVAIVGPSGAGKSTLLHILGALDRPTSGEVLLDGRSVYRLSEPKRALLRNAKIGFMFQFYNLMPEFTALENVALPAWINRNAIRNTMNHSLRSGSWQAQYAIRERAKQLLNEVGLGNRVNHRPGELSGGEQQRVAIARALVNAPELLLCDEPTGNLDSKASDSVYDILFGLKPGRETTLIIVTHDASVSKRASRTVHLKDGNIS
jgi:lipoprotein-releasing system ATP-binding protein